LNHTLENSKSLYEEKDESANSCTKPVPQPSDKHACPRDACTFVSAF